jgi:hypothetical protein
MRESGILTGATLLFWVLLAYPAWRLGGQPGIEGLTFAALLCLVPGWLVFFVSSRYRVGSAQAIAVLMGTTLRLMFVLFGAFILTSVRKNLGFREFLVWLIVFYLATLTIETWLVLKRTTE